MDQKNQEVDYRKDQGNYQHIASEKFEINKNVVKKVLIKII
jgi:hypothetical protein